jgi:hypothetical protein
MPIVRGRKFAYNAAGRKAAGKYTEQVAATKRKSKRKPRTRTA